MERRLAAIIASDVAGFSALAERAEPAALRALKGHLSALEPLIGLRGGRIFKTTGDGFLAEFGSVVDAVTCAEDMQNLLAERNAGRGDGPEMLFRMGVHVGDVVMDGGDIFGDGVNIAARLEALAAPGGIAVSGRVQEDVAGKLDLRFRDLGPRELKNIARPVRVFALDPVSAPAAAPAAPARAHKPSVAVLAFDNLSSDPEQDYFADGITEDIITGLSRVPWLFVIARNSSFSYKGLAVDIRRIGRELGVRYVLEGSVRKAGNRLRVTGQLIDAETGAHTWADRYDGALEDIFELQDRITESVIGAIAPQIRQSEIARAARKRPDSLDAYDRVLRAHAAIAAFRLEEAVEHLAAAIRQDPEYREAQALWAWLSTIIWHPTYRIGAEHKAQGLAVAQEVLAAQDADIEAQAYAGYVTAFRSDDFERGISYVQRAMDLCPSCISAWGSSCMLHAMRGEADIAISHGEEALRLSPRDPLIYRAVGGLIIANMAKRDFPAVLASVEKGRNFRTVIHTILAHEIAARWHLGQTEKAKSLVPLYRSCFPTRRVGLYRSDLESVRALAPHVYEPVLEGLAAAGVPE